MVWSVGPGLSCHVYVIDIMESLRGFRDQPVSQISAQANKKPARDVQIISLTQRLPLPLGLQLTYPPTHNPRPTAHMQHNPQYRPPTRYTRHLGEHGQTRSLNMPRLVAVRTPFTPGPMSEQRRCQEHDATRTAATLPHWRRAEGASAMLGFSAM